jgi:hypothetical protein
MDFEGMPSPRATGHASLIAQVHFPLNFEPEPGTWNSGSGSGSPPVPKSKFGRVAVHNYARLSKTRNTKHGTWNLALRQA